MRYVSFLPDPLTIRPLPAVMLHYARSDTHFLLHIYDQIRIELSKASDAPPDLLLEVLARSSETALQVWSRRTYDYEDGLGAGGWRSLVRKWHKEAEWGLQYDADGEPAGPGRGTAFEVFRAVHAWRDAVARELDESTDYVLPTHMLFKLATRPYLAAAKIDVATVLGSCVPAPPVVRKRAAELAGVVRKAVEDEEKRPVLAMPGQASAAKAAASAVSTGPAVVPQSHSLFAPAATARASGSQGLADRSARATMSSFLTPVVASIVAPVAKASALLGGPIDVASSTSDVVRQVLGSFSLSFATTTPVASTSKVTLDAIGTTDHVFVPAAERVTKRTAPAPVTSTHIRFDDAGTPTPDEEIIVQSRERKGKRKAVAAPPPVETELSSVPSSRQSSGAEAALALVPDAARPSKTARKKDKLKVEPFDYATEPSLVAGLDGPAPAKVAKPRKRKRDEGQVSGSATFRAPAKAPKPSGKSQTF